MTSSPIRERCTPKMAIAESTSTTKSRSATASKLLLNRDSKLSSSATACESNGNDDPASAPAPRTETLVLLRDSKSLCISLEIAQPCASRWCATGTGCACWRWVYPGIIIPSSDFDLVSKVCCKEISSPIISEQIRLVQRRRSVAT